LELVAAEALAAELGASQLEASIRTTSKKSASKFQERRGNGRYELVTKRESLLVDTGRVSHVALSKIHKLHSLEDTGGRIGIAAVIIVLIINTTIRSSGWLAGSSGSGGTRRRSTGRLTWGNSTCGRSSSNTSLAPSDNGIVARQRRQSARDLLVDSRWDLAPGGRVVESANQARAFIHRRISSIAVVDDLCQGCSVPAGEEVAVEGVSCRITVGKDKGLLALTWGPSAGKFGGVPVDFVEEVRDVGKSCGADAIGWPGHVVLVVVDASGLVQAGWEVDVGSQRRAGSIAVLVGEANAGSFVGWILDTDTVKTVRVRRVQRRVGIGAASWASPLNWLNNPVLLILDEITTRRRSSKAGVSNHHAKSWWERLDGIGGLVEARRDQYGSERK
jgi:hypothetical protein